MLNIMYIRRNMSDPSEILGAAGDNTAGLQFTHRVPNIIAGA